MKILYIDHHAALPSSGGDCRAVQLAQGWQQCGDEVTIVTAGYSHRRGAEPLYPFGRYGARQYLRLPTAPTGE